MSESHPGSNIRIVQDDTASKIASMKEGCSDSCANHAKPDVHPIKDKIGQGANYN